MKIQEEIIQITSEYLEDKIDYLKLSNATKQYKAALEKLCDEDINIDAAKTDLNFNNGKALGTFWAALCLDDIIRTRNFIRGINKAIKNKINNKKTIHILYAGTGPFATLILPLMLRYSKEEIKYTFLEVNPLSFNLVKKVISNLLLDNYDINFVMQDATQYKIDIENLPDIIISETMQNSLAKEQQVPIFLNLMSQVNDNTIFIPEKIEIFIGLKEANVPFEKIKPKHIIKVEKVLDISSETIFTDKKNRSNTFDFTTKTTQIENIDLIKYNQIAIITEIQVYKNEKIRINESGLTTPIFIKEIPDNLKKAAEIKTKYIISSNPKLDCKVTFR